MKKTVIIQGSSRSDGNTRRITKFLQGEIDADFIDLSNKKIGHFDYEYKNADDDFLPLMENIITKYDTIIFATPVYWYSMSGVLKVFFDRLSDLLHYKKELGRKLRGKNMAMLSCSSGSHLKKAFSMPFEESADYLGMHYLGDIHTWLENDTNIPENVQLKIKEFATLLN